MRKKLTKKLVLNKKTISNLDREEMNSARGASVIYICSESCSVIYICCDPTKDPQLFDQEPNPDQGQD